MLRVIGLMLQIAFYTFYVTKIIIQKKQQIRTNQMGIGNKSRCVLWNERIMGCATLLALLTSVCSIILVPPQPSPLLAAAGIAAGLPGVALFAAATITMKTSWRVGIPEEKTALVTGGLYQISRNPAFVGFDLLYLSTCLLFPNPVLFLISLWAAVMLHFQILQEETYLQNTFGEEYAAYTRQTLRYLGRRQRV